MAGIKEEKKIYLVGIYCRLSKDDGTDNESASIATQKSILTDYVKKQGWHIAKTYVDDGYSGTNFQRPSFQNMIKDIESGLINCVITKDLSRLGRNYLDCGLYLEVFFPEHNVRYIAVNDGVDTLNKSAMDITPFRNILNEMYAADISVKIKSAYRARFQQGKFMGTTAPYGYIKDPADHNHLLIDDKVAHVVKEIFDLALKGNEDKKEAGEALIAACAGLKTVSTGGKVGEYHGFTLSASYNMFSNAFELTIKGKCSYKLEIGKDPVGNMQRIHNTLSSIDRKLTESEQKLETVQQQLATAQEEVKKPFPKEAELNEKMERLSELNALLNMDEKGNETIMADEDIGREGSSTDSRDAVEEKELPETADRIHKPSILERLKQEKAQQNTAEQPSVQKTAKKKHEQEL